MTPTILKSTQYGGKIFQGVESTVMVKKVDPRLRDPASERPIIGLTDNRLYRQADNLSVSADRQFCLSAIDRYTWIWPITIESANISSYRHILVSIVPISHQDY